MNIGDILHTSAEREAAPVGAVIQLYGDLWTKVAPDRWTCPNLMDRPNAHPNGWAEDTSGIGYTVVRWPVPEPLVVGDHLYTAAQRAAAPVGTQIRPTNLTHVVWRKAAANQWRRVDGEGDVRCDANPVDSGLDWFSDLEPGTTPCYEVVEWPVPEVASDVVADYAGLLALPVGEVFFVHTQPEVRWVVDSDEFAIREGDTRGVRVALDVFEGPANAGHLRTGVAEVAEERAYPGVGEFITSREQYTALPIGAVIRSRLDVRRTKQDADTWTSEGRADRRNNRLRIDNYYRLESLPEPEVALPAVGETVQTLEQMAALPVGTVLSCNRGRVTYTRRGDRLWWTDSGMAGLPDESMSVPDYNTVVSYPVEVGTVITSAEQFSALPAGAVVVNRNGVEWVKSAGGTFGPADNSSGGYSVEGMNAARWWTVRELPEAPAQVEVPAEVPAVGESLTTVAQFDALPVGTVIQFRGGTRRTKVEGGSWSLGDGDPLSADGLNMSGWVVHSIPGGDLAEPEPSVTAAEAEAERDRAVAEAVSAAVEARNEEFLSTLREHWDGVNFNEREINDVLSDLGLEQIDVTEYIRVTVTVTGRTELDNCAVEELIEGSCSADLTSSVTAEWIIDDMDFEDIEVTRGQCGCGLISESDIQQRLYDNDVSFTSFAYEGSCQND